MDGRSRIYRVVTVQLPIDQYAVLERRARDYGMSVEDFVTIIVAGNVGKVVPNPLADRE